MTPDKKYVEDVRVRMEKADGKSMNVFAQLKTKANASPVRE